MELKVDKDKWASVGSLFGLELDDDEHGGILFFNCGETARRKIRDI